MLQLGSSLECTSPAPGSAALSSATAAGWDSYDPTQAIWDDEPISVAYNGYDNQTVNASIDYGANQGSSIDDATNNGAYQEHAQDINEYDQYQQTVDG